MHPDTTAVHAVVPSV